MEITIVENLQRADLNPMEEARAFKSLMDQFTLSQEEVSTRVGKKRSTVANSLRLLQLPLDVQEDLFEGRLTAGHARAILSIPEPQKQRNLRNLIVTKGLSVREAEATAKRLTAENKPKPPKSETIEVQMRNLQEEMSMKIGLQVYIRPVNNSTGKVEIQYQSLDDFETLCDFIGIEKS
ncbi:TPA: hypothetical protein DDW35_08385 [Candidatus Sumerlaeota bacterium]|nr:hypothetical protein [Candidatus Sumerlaeota bacterium]